jgi:hypothetical protein
MVFIKLLNFVGLHSMQPVINNVGDGQNVKVKNGAINGPSSAWLKS